VQREAGGGSGEGESSSQVWPSLQHGSRSPPRHAACQATAWSFYQHLCISAPASVSLQTAARLHALSSSVPTERLRHGRGMQLGRTESIMGELIQINSVFIKSTPQRACMNAEKPLSTPEEALAFLKPAGTASLCKASCSAPPWLLLQGSSLGAGRLGGLGPSKDHRGLPTPGPADAEWNQAAAGRAQILGRC